MKALKWLYPGMHVKRWLLILMFGIILCSLGFAYLLRQFYEFGRFPEWVYYLTLQFLPRELRGGLFLLLGGGSLALASLQLSRSLLAALIPSEQNHSLVDLVYQHRFLRRGPRIVAIGGGTGLSTLLRGLKEYSGNVTAIVTVADDGGSSGRLRRELGVLPPGDFRNCIVALADVEPLMTRLFQYRFREGSGLEGHSFGNLFIAAMSDVTGSFEQAILESSRVLAVRGQILPSTLSNVRLGAVLEDGETVLGESDIPQSGKAIKRVFIEPVDAQAYPEAIRAILEADLIILGPGSLYTSVLPNLLVDGIKKAVQASAGVRVYICNVATQKGETDGFDARDHVAAIEREVGAGLFDYVLVNSNVRPDRRGGGGSEAVTLEGDHNELPIKVVPADVVDQDRPHFHDPRKLASALMHLYYDRSHDSRSASRQPTIEVARA